MPTFIEESSSESRRIEGVATSIAAFVGRAARGPTGTPVLVASAAEFLRRFGAVERAFPLSLAVQQFYANGGCNAVVLRLQRAARTATCRLPAGPGQSLRLRALDEGVWGNRLRATVEPANPASPQLFTLRISERDRTDPSIERIAEVFRDLDVRPGTANFVGTALAGNSLQVRLLGRPPARRPDPTVTPVAFTRGSDGDPLTDADLASPTLESARRGLYALDAVDLFNLLVVPPLAPGTELAPATHAAALAYAGRRRAIYLADAPIAWSLAADPATAAAQGLDTLLPRTDSGALYFPALRVPDPMDAARLIEVPPAGAVAGVIARTDAQRGVWKAPAGLDAALVGVPALAATLDDRQNAGLNALGINALRRLPVGVVAWGARTLAGADALGSDWKYLPVRRTAYFIAESLERGTRWAAFERNDELLWTQLRMHVGEFMQALFRQGAFQGSSPREAWAVQCGRETTTQAEIDAGLVHLHVGFAALRPAEFHWQRLRLVTLGA